MILKISAALVLGVCPFAKAEKVEQKKEQRKEVREFKEAKASISGSTENGKGVVKYGGKEVWKGKVRKGLNTIADSVNGEDLAAAFDGKRLVWENKKGAGKQLKPRLEKVQKAAEDLAEKVKRGL